MKKIGLNPRRQVVVDVKEVELTTLWGRVIEEVAANAPQHRAFLQLTKPLGLLHNDDQTTLLVAAPNLFAKDVLESRLRTVVSEVLTRELGSTTNIAVTVDETLEVVTTSTQDVEVEFVAPKSGTGRDDAPVSKATDTSTLNPRYIFETFVIGASNRFAHAAAVAVAEAPAKAYNPLFIYGESGLGKTHLLHAIGAYAQELYGNVRVKYVSSEEFTNDFINSIRDDKASAFQRRYRDLDILLVDDIQFLENKERTQEEFFHTFNTLYNANKQIVISSDRPPKQLTTLEDRLRSRFEWGLITDIQPPELETRIAILRKKAAQDKLNAPDDVLEFIASKISTNIRELESFCERCAGEEDERTPPGEPPQLGEHVGGFGVRQPVGPFAALGRGPLQRRLQILVAPAVRQLGNHDDRGLPAASSPRGGAAAGGHRRRALRALGELHGRRQRHRLREKQRRRRLLLLGLVAAHDHCCFFFCFF